MSGIPKLFAYLGLFVFLNRLRRIVDFFWFHFLRPDSYQQYLRGHETPPYALVTGSTDGIGKSLAKVLYSKGFNLILHGRNEEKVKRVVEEVRASDNRPNGKIEYFIADATESNHDFEVIAKRYELLDVTVFINNVGGSVPELKTIDQHSEGELRRTINLNFDFPFFLTRAFLPRLRGNSLHKGPVQVVFTGSVGGDASIPFLCAYSSSKNFLKRATGILHEEERALHGSNVSFMYLNVGEVRSSGLGGKPSLLRPAADEFAKAVVRSLGCGRRVVVPWYPHEIAVGILNLMPESLSGWIIRMKAAAVVKDITFKMD